MKSAAAAAYSGMRSLSDVLDRTRVIRARRAASLAETADDYLYGIAEDGEVVEYRITKWASKRVYYVRERLRYRKARAPMAYEYLSSPERRWSESAGWVERDDDSVTWVIVGYADRAALDRDGQVRTSVHEAHPDAFLYRSRETAEAIAHGDIKQLRRQMASVHPDRGGTAEQFMAARKRYERALRRAS